MAIFGTKLRTVLAEATEGMTAKRGNGLVAPLIRVRFGVIFEILAEDSFRKRFLHGCITVLVLVGHLYGDQRRLAVYGADADMILHILVGDAVTVQNVAVAV